MVKQLGHLPLRKRPTPGKLELAFKAGDLRRAA